MPRRKRVSKRRAALSDGWVIWANDGDIPDDTPELETARNDWLEYEFFFDRAELAEMFRVHGARALAVWEAENGAGTRSERWEKFAAAKMEIENS